jgi:uroporphyrinogen-III synthase
LRALADSSVLNAARRLPLFAVGSGTAQLASDLGFENVIAGTGTGADLVPVIAEAAAASAGPLVHVRGEEVAFDLKGALAGHGIDLREVIAYRARPAETLSPQTRELLAAGAIDAVILMSPRTGLIFTRLIATEGLRDAARKLVLLCLSPAVAATIEPLAAARVEVAGSPNAASMLGSVTRVATLWSGV